MQIFIVAPAMPDSIFLRPEKSKDFSRWQRAVWSCQGCLFLDFGCKRLNWFCLKRSRDFCGFPALSWRLWEYSMKSGKFSVLPPPTPSEYLKFHKFLTTKKNFSCSNFPRNWPTFPITDYRVHRLLRELINNVTSSRKRFYLHLSPQPPWHIAICLTKAEFSRRVHSSRTLFDQFLFDNEILYTWRVVFIFLTFITKSVEKWWKNILIDGKSLKI